MNNGRQLGMPAPYRLWLGTDPTGSMIDLPLYGRNTLVMGSDGSARHRITGSLLRQVAGVRLDRRQIALIDLRQDAPTEWRSEASILAVDADGACALLEGLVAEAGRRHEKVLSNPARYWDGRIYPNAPDTQIVLFVRDLDTLDSLEWRGSGEAGIRARSLLADLMREENDDVAISVIAEARRPCPLSRELNGLFSNRLIGHVDGGISMGDGKLHLDALSDRRMIAVIGGVGKVLVDMGAVRG